MKIKAVIHEAEEGGYRTEVPSIQECVSQGDSFEELRGSLYEAIDGCLSVDAQNIEIGASQETRLMTRFPNA